MKKSNRGFCSGNSNDLIWPGFKHTWEFIHVHLFSESFRKKNWMSYVDKVGGFFSNQGHVTLRLMIRSGPRFQFIRDFIHVRLICMLQEDPNKTEWVMLMTKSNRGFFSNQWGCSSTNNDPIWPVFLHVLDNIHCHLICKFKEDSIKTEWVTLMTNQTEAFPVIKGT